MRDVNPNAAKCMDKGLLGLSSEDEVQWKEKNHRASVISTGHAEATCAPCMLLRSLKGPEKEPDTVAVLPWG